MVPRLLFLIFALLVLASPCSAKTGYLLVAFGSSAPGANAAYEAIEQAYRARFPGSPIVWAWTSQKIRAKLGARGCRMLSIAEGLDRLAAAGVDEVVIQSLHAMPGAEFAALARSALTRVDRDRDKFRAVYLGRPLLESVADAEAAIDAALASLEDRRPGDAVVFMAHGNDKGRAELALAGAAAVLRAKDKLAWLTGVEGGEPLDSIIAALKKARVRKVWLAPFMIVAGEHAQNDLAGPDPDSWASRLRAAGFAVETSLKGLGETPGAAEIFLRHSGARDDDLTREPLKP